MSATEIDRNLLKRCIAQEPGSWRDFVDRFMPLFIHVVQHSAHARSVMLSADDIDDLCAEVFLALLANDFRVLQQFRGQSSLATYLTVVARRIVVKELSRRKMAEALGHVGAHQSALERAHVAYTDAAPRVEDIEEIRSLIDELPPNEAEVVRQFHLEGKSYRQISHDLGIPENSVGPTLTRAREHMRRRSQMQT